MVYQIIVELCGDGKTRARVYGDCAGDYFDYTVRRDAIGLEKEYHLYSKNPDMRKEYMEKGEWAELQWVNDWFERKGFDLVMLTDSIAIFRLRSWWENLKMWLGIRT